MSRLRALIVVICGVLLIACGRYGYDSLEGSGHVVDGSGGGGVAGSSVGDASSAGGATPDSGLHDDALAAGGAIDGAVDAVSLNDAAVDTVPPIDAAVDAQVPIDGAADAPVDACNLTTHILSPVADTWLASLNPMRNHGRSNVLTVSDRGSALLRFDGAAVTTKPIVAVELSLYVVGTAATAGSYLLSVEEMLAANGAWLEGASDATVGGLGEPTYDHIDEGRAITWAGGVWGTSCATNCGPRVGSLTTGPVSSQRIDFSLPAALVERWRDSPATNYGIVVNAYDSATWFFASRENAAAANVPQLRIQYCQGT